MLRIPARVALPLFSARAFGSHSRTPARFPTNHDRERLPAAGGYTAKRGEIKGRLREILGHAQKCPINLFIYQDC